MARIDPDALQDPVDVYLAASLNEARRIERVLSERGVDYTVQVETIGRSTLFGSVRHGVAFFVAASQAGYCRTLLVESGFSKGLIPE